MTPPSVRNYLSEVKLLHLMLGFEFPHLSSHELQLTLRGIDRLAQHRPHHAPLITPTLLCTLVARGADFDPADLTFSCALSFAFFLFARISNLVRDSFVTSGVHEHRCICRGDVFPTHYGLCVQFTWSKTIQFGECVLAVPLVRILDSPICPVHLFYLMCEIIPAPNRLLSLLFPLVQVDCDRFLRVSLFRFCVIACSLLGSPRLICFEVTPFVEGVPRGPSLVAS